MPLARLKKKILSASSRAVFLRDKMLRRSLTKGVSRERHITHQHLREIAERWPESAEVEHRAD